jgi:hypothetical protein
MSLPSVPSVPAPSLPSSILGRRKVNPSYYSDDSESESPSESESSSESDGDYEPISKSSNYGDRRKPSVRVRQAVFLKKAKIASFSDDQLKLVLVKKGYMDKLSTRTKSLEDELATIKKAM